MRAMSSVVRRLFAPGEPTLPERLLPEYAPRPALWRRSLRDAATVIAITVGLLIVLECGLRVAGTIREDATRWREVLGEGFFRAHRRTPVMGWERRPGWRGAFGGSERAFDATGHVTIDSEQLASRPGNRIAFVGDSNTFGFGVRAEESFAQVTERLLPGVHAINLGVSGYSSYQGRLVVERDLATLRPDAVVLSFNFNDRAALDEPDSPEHFQHAYGRLGAVQTLARAAEVPYMTRAFTALLRRAGVLPGAPRVDVETLRPRVDEARYRDNLAAMVIGARQMGAQVLLLVLGDSPIASHHLRQGLAALATDPELAIGHLELALTSTPAHRDLARLYLAHAYRLTGRTDRLAKVLRVTRAPAAYRMIRLDTDYQAIMREVGAALDVEVVEGAAALRPEHYVDVCHFNAAGHAAVATALRPRLTKLLARQKAARKTGR
jgi:lysophospholipase L1-like esterase